MGALDRQVGGNHYREGGIQPAEFIESNDIRFLEGCVIKRCARHNRPGGKGRQDILKAIHELEILLELRYPEEPTNAKVEHKGIEFPSKDWVQGLRDEGLI